MGRVASAQASPITLAGAEVDLNEKSTELKGEWRVDRASILHNALLQSAPQNLVDSCAAPLAEEEIKITHDA